MTALAAPSPPDHLSARTKRLWRDTLSSYELTAQSIEVLLLACEALDRAAQARRALRREGLWRENRFGDLVPHPAIRVEKDSAAAAAKFLAQLGLAIPEED
jgi:P27 family predicted phage terminase small subunit